MDEKGERALLVMRNRFGFRWERSIGLHDDVSLDEAGTDLTAFTAFPPAQWRCLRTTNAIERIFGEFKRRTKTQGAFPTPEAMLIVLWGTLATGGMRRPQTARGRINR